MRLTCAPLIRIVAALPILVGCASVSRPPGGPEDHDAPQIVTISVDTNATNVKAGKIEIQFDEVISERPSVSGGSGQAPTLDDLVLISPRTGSAKVSWHRDRITIEPRGGFKSNTAYRVTLLPGISDVRGNVRREAYSLIFTTGAALPPYTILGQLFDWEASAPARAAIVEAIANPGTKDSLTYVSFADSTGRFGVGPLGPGNYLVRGFIDADNNHALGVLEKWDSVTVVVTTHSPVTELLAIQRDTAPPGIQRVEVLDSAWIRVVLDKPFDPHTTLQTALVVLKRTDSTIVQAEDVMSEGRAASLRPRPVNPTDSAPRPVRPAIDTVSTRAPEAKPSMAPPERAFVIHLGAGMTVKPDDKLILTIRGIRNLIGHVGTANYEFTVPKPPPPVKPPAAVKPPPSPR